MGHVIRLANTLVKFGEVSEQVNRGRGHGGRDYNRNVFFLWECFFYLLIVIILLFLLLF